MGNCWSSRTRHSRRGSSGSPVVYIPLAQLSPSSGNPSVDQPPPVPPRTTSRGHQHQPIRHPVDQPSQAPSGTPTVQPPPAPARATSRGHQQLSTRSQSSQSLQSRPLPPLPPRMLHDRQPLKSEHHKSLTSVHHFHGGETFCEQRRILRMKTS